MMQRPPIKYGCNKCGYYGDKSQHDGCDYFACSSMEQQYIDRLTKQRDELAAALALIKPGNELGDFLIYATMPWAAMKDIVRMEEALAAVKESKEN
jgi:hypothetical protein